MNDARLVLGALLLLYLSTRGSGVAPTDGGGQTTTTEPDQEPRQDLGVTVGSTNPFHSCVMGDSSANLPPLADPHPKRDPYIDQIFARELEHKPAMRELYNVDRLRRIARAASAYYGVPPQWVWGMLSGESNWIPVGVYARSATKAKAARSSAYGMGQILRGRWNGERKYIASTVPSGSMWDHADLLDPKLSIWTVAASLGRGLKNRGGGMGRSMESQVEAIVRMALEAGGLRVGHWWAGSSVKGAQNKVRQILRRGGEVYRDGPSKGGGWDKSGPTKPQDDLPPWCVGSMDPTSQAMMLNKLAVLTTAGLTLNQRNPGLT